MFLQINSPSHDTNVRLFGSWNNWSEPATSKHVAPNGTLYFLVNVSHNTSSQVQFKFELNSEWFCNETEYDIVLNDDGYCNNSISLLESSHQSNNFMTTATVII